MTRKENAIPNGRKPDAGPDPDVAHVVTGPVGSAHLTDPAASGDIEGDVYELPGADRPTEIPAADPPRQADRESRVPSDGPGDADPT